ncbi:MAG: YggT family protein [Patescibacteria group bacterium]
MIWLVNTVLRLVSLLILLRVAAGWLDPSRGSEYHRLLHVLTEPILAPCRRLFYLRGMRIDFTPLIVLILLELARGLIVLGLRALGA